MGAEGSPKAEKPVNWNEILRHSYMFSQGHEVLQQNIFYWLAQGPLAGKHPNPADLKKNIVATYVQKSGVHGTYALGAKEYREDESLKAQQLIESMQSGAAKEQRSFADLAKGMISRDYAYLVENKGRHREGGNSTRDPWSSFIIDFGILQKGTGPWLWDAMPEVYKEMWRGIVAELEEGTYVGLDAIIDVFLEHHPNLSPDDVARIEMFRKKRSI